MSGASHQAAADFLRAMGPVAREVLGEPSHEIKDKELRYGTRGSLCVDLGGGTWFDHEANQGGGVLDFLKVRKNLEKPDALEWLRSRNHLPAEDGKPRIVGTYHYTDAAGALLFQVLRYEPKNFCQRRPDDAGGWVWKMAGVERVVYRLPEVLDAVERRQAVFICEGEKACDALAERGLTATCSPGGAGKWRAEYSQWFARADVIVLPDADEPGQAHAKQVVKALGPVAWRIRSVGLPGLPAKGDVVDYLDSGHTAADLLHHVHESGPQGWANIPHPDDVDDPDAEPSPDAAPPADEPDGPPPAASASGKRPWATYTPAECEDSPPRRYIIKGLIAEGDHVGIIGQPGSGKSLLGPALGYAVARGRMIFGRRVRPGPVLYLAAEDGHGLRQRTRALCRRFGDAPDFHVLPESPDLLDADSADHKRLKEVIERVQPCLILIDTVARSFPGLRENESDGMARVVTVARDLTRLIEPPPAVATIHHVAKDAGSTPRGHGSLFGDQDVCLLVEGSGASLRTVTLGKNRNGASDATFSFTVETEHLGEDEDGDAVLAPLAVEPNADAPSPRDRAKEDRLRDGPALVLRELRDLIGQHGEMVQPSAGYPFVRCVTRDHFRKHLIGRGWFPENVLLAGSDGPKLSESIQDHYEV